MANHMRHVICERSSDWLVKAEIDWPTSRASKKKAIALRYTVSCWHVYEQKRENENCRQNRNVLIYVYGRIHRKM